MLAKRFSHIFGSALCLLALLLFSVTAYAQPAKGKGRDIVGTIVDVDSKPVANATVTVSGGGPSATTGPDGSFKLTGVATANVSLEVNADGFPAKLVPVLDAASQLQLQVVLVKPAPPPVAPPIETRMVGGVVSDAAHAPVAGATVRVHGTEIQVVTGADGSFTLPGVAISDVTLDIEAPNQPPVSVAAPSNKAAVVVTVGAPLPPPPIKRSVHGKVVETSGEPLAGAQVQVVGIPDATAFTEANGSFVIENLPPGKVALDITAPEHESHLLEVPPGQESVSVSLGLAKGEQIVIEGRAPSFTKENITGGGSVIDGKDLNRVSAPTLDDAMVGKLAGANMQANSGAPGGGAQLRLRGISTINGQASPLYVIDGVVISNIATASGVNAITAAAAGGNPSNQDNPVNRVADLNPADVESVEVLKGASAAALYGSKAANGVVIITTKRGRMGENHATVTQRIGFSQRSKTYGSRKWSSIDEVRTSFCGATDTPDQCNTNPYVQAYMAANGRTFDHEAEISRIPFLMETLANVTGGTENGNYYGSVLLTDQPAVVKGTFYQKQTGRIAIGYKFGDRVKLGLTANLLHSDSDRGLSNNDNAGVSNYFVLSATPNFVDLRPKNGVYPTNLFVNANPLQNVELFQNREELLRMITGATATVDAYASADAQHRIKLLGNVGIDSFDQKNHILSPTGLTFENDDKLLGTVVDGTTTNTNFNLGTSAVWTFSPQSRVLRSALTGGLTFESVDTHSVYVIAKNLTAGQPKVDTATSVRTNEALRKTKEVGGYVQEEMSLLGDQLSLLGGLLAERSSLNGDSNKYFLYPKIGAAYSFIKPAKAGEARALEDFDALRARVAYGETGNRPNYGNKFTALSAINNIGGNAGLIVGGNAGDIGIEPERQREIEGGFDVASKDQRVVAELTLYQRNISNMLLQQALATTTGFTTQFTNGGSLRNRGIEAAVAVKPVKQIDWTSRGTLTLNRSQITSLPDGIPAFNVPVGFGAGLGAYRIQEGKSATQIVATIDKNGTLATVGDGEPSFRVGWSNVINVGDFAFSTLLDWQHGSDVINLTTQAYDANGNAPDQAAAAKRLAALAMGDPRPYIEDGSFVKVREVSIAYNLPKRLASQLGPLHSLQLSASGRNLLTFTGYSGLDPEVSNFGNQPIGRNFDVTPYPPSRTFWFSITAGI
ncbi:MAG TPA: SusC/RagA family TonB-linked outer membrane protein [Kofleriaceae bacterium]